MHMVDGSGARLLLDIVKHVVAMLAGALTFAAYVMLASLSYDMAIANNGPGPLKVALLVAAAGVANAVVVFKVLK